MVKLNCVEVEHLQVEHILLNVNLELLPAQTQRDLSAWVRQLKQNKEKEMKKTKMVSVPKNGFSSVSVNHFVCC